MSAQPGEGTDVPADIDLHTTAEIILYVVLHKDDLGRK